MNYKLWGIIALLTSVTCFSGCSSTSQAGRYTPTDFLITALDAQRLSYVPRWAANLQVTPGQTLASATSLGDLIVTVEIPSNLVTGIDANNGSIRWRTQMLTESERLYEPNRSGDVIIINSGKELFELSAKTGKRIGESKLAFQVTDGPVISNDMAIFGSVGGKVFAHDIKTGYARWTAELPAGILIRPIITGQNIFAADAYGVYALFNLKSGEREWTGRTFDRISAEPVASNTTQLIYIPSEDQNLYAVNRATGKDRWIYRTSSALRIDPTLLGNTLFINQNDTLAAVDAISGELLWKRSGGLKPVDLIDQRLIVNAGVYMMILDVSTGKKLREVPVVEPLQSILTGPDDSLILVAPDGKITRIDPHR